MLISQIVPIDANAQRFATDHVTSLLSPNGGSDFDTYLARVMQRESTPGTIAQPSDPSSAQTTPYYTDPYAPQAQSHNSYEAYRSETAHDDHYAPSNGDEARVEKARIENERASDAALDKSEKNQVDQKKDDAGAAEATREADQGNDAAAEERVADDPQAAKERGAAERGESENATDDQAAHAEAAARADEDAAAADAKSAASKASHDAAAAAASKASPNGDASATQAAAKNAAGAQNAAETSKARGNAETAEATGRAARGGVAAAKAAEAAGAEASGEAGATVELEVNLEATSKESAARTSHGETDGREAELAAKDATTEAVEKASARGRDLSQKAMAEAAGSEAAGRGEQGREAGEQRREQAKQAKIDVTDVRNKSAAERAASEQTGSNTNRDQGGSHQHSSNGENGARSFGDLIGGESGRVGQSSTRTLTNPTLNRAADQLSRQLNENLNSEIVRQAKFIVRTNESGEIKLHLRPESLGSVRIALQMQDGHIAGRIIVDNQTVREVFEQNLASLERAFLEQGLETSGLDVAVADSGGQGREQGETARGRGATKSRGQSALASAVPTVENYETHELVDVTV